MGKNYYEYEVREIKSNKFVKSIYIPENTDSRGWVLGQWYKEEDTKNLKPQIKGKDGLFIAIYKETHHDSEGGDLF